MVTEVKQYVTNEDVSPVRCSALIGRLIKGTTLLQRKEAVDYIRANAIVREFVAGLMLSQKRVESELRRLANDIS